MDFKYLSETEVNNLSGLDYRSYMKDKRAYEWSIKTFAERDEIILSDQIFFVNRRGVENMSLEEEFEIIFNEESDNESYKEWNIQGLSDRINEYQKMRNNGEKFTFFWSTISPFSQWFKSNFIGKTYILDGIGDTFNNRKKHALNGLFSEENQLFSSAEQFMMYHKAIIFLDRENAKKIMNTSDVRKIKELGRQVVNYDEYVWKYYRSKVVYEGNKAKFMQNDELLKILLDSKGTTIVEASPNDSIWGIGLLENDTRALKRDTWLGKNLLGEILTRIRIEIMEKY